MIDSFRGDYEFLSNFYVSPFVINGVTYPTGEHAFQAAKCVDPSERLRVIAAATPGKAKQLGRRVQLVAQWNEIRLDVMLIILKHKFAPGSELAEKLLATGSETLVEGNTWNDTYWGVCRGKGENHLGRLLMKVRHELRTDHEI